MAKICKNNIPLLFFLIVSFFSFFSNVVESGAGPDANLLTKYCATLAEDSHGDAKKVQRSKDCSNYLDLFKKGDWSSFIGIKFIEMSNSISSMSDEIDAGLKDRKTIPANADSMKKCLGIHHSSLLKIDEAYDIYKNNVPINKSKDNKDEELKKKLELLVVEVTNEEETCQKSGGSPLGQKVVDGTKYITKAICQFGYAPQNSKHC